MTKLIEAITGIEAVSIQQDMKSPSARSSKPETATQDEPPHPSRPSHKGRIIDVVV